LRVFRDFREAQSEIKRDLAERGVRVNAGYQSRQGEEYWTREYQNYGYTILQPRFMDLDPTQPWAQVEWTERIKGVSGFGVNPGEAWNERPEVWKELLELGHKGRVKFSYTYSERYAQGIQILKVIEELKIHPSTRQAFVGIWNPVGDTAFLGRRRVPCSLGYHFMIREDKLDMTYMMRSSDFITHWDNDCWLSLQLQFYVADKIERPPGKFSNWICSLHAYEKDLEGVF
jgi:thymidylate synthase